MIRLALIVLLLGITTNGCAPDASVGEPSESNVPPTTEPTTPEPSDPPTEDPCQASLKLCLWVSTALVRVISFLRLQTRLMFVHVSE